MHDVTHRGLTRLTGRTEVLEEAEGKRDDGRDAQQNEDSVGKGIPHESQETFARTCR